jgi:PAP2 superfamily
MFHMNTVTAAEKSTCSSSVACQWLIASLSGLFVVIVFPGVIAEPFLHWSMAGCAVLLSAAVWREEVRSDLLCVAFWLPAAAAISTIALFVTIVFSPRAIDASLNLGVGRYLMNWASLHPDCNKLFFIVYDSLPLAMAAGIALSDHPRRVAWALLTVGIIALPLYIAFPATGPRWVSHPQAPRNCMPSLHFTWAIMLAYYSTRRLRPAFILFAALTAIATLTTGEHYLVDLIAAIPFTWFCIWAVVE